MPLPYPTDWRDFVQRPNPVACALMARMKIAKEDRPLVKLECLQMLVGLNLNGAQRQLLSSFIDTYLNLNEAEEAVFQQALAEIMPEKKEKVMELTTSWMQKGIQQGIQIGDSQGQHKATLNIVTRQLRKRFGAAFVRMSNS